MSPPSSIDHPLHLCAVLFAPRSAVRSRSMIGVVLALLLQLISGNGIGSDIALARLLQLTSASNNDVKSKCRGAAPPKCGRIASYCDYRGNSYEPRAYYWTGTSCAPD